MTSGQLNQVLRQLCRLVGAGSVEELSDRQLLEAFTRDRDPAAFEVLVQRHGPLVLGVCKRVLHDEHAAEDAFQATFMVLARKAAAIRRQEAVGSWLCGTAYRLSLKARAAAGRRRDQERQAGQMAKSQTEPDPLWHELRPVLDEELNRLPEKYRAPLILCYLQGKTNEAAARELGWPAGSISYRLAQGRELLRTRLQKRGIVLSGVVLSALLAENATAAVQAPLAAATVQASLAFAAGEAALAGTSAGAFALAQAGVRGLFLAQLKVFGALALGLALVAGTVGILWWEASQPSGIADPKPAPVLDSEPRLALAFSQSQRFGLACPHLRDPRDATKPKLLTREPNGLTNNTCFRIDGFEYLYGVEVPRIRWARDKHGKALRESKIADRAWQSVLEVADQQGKVELRLTQTVELIRGEQTGLLDTALVKYHIQNVDATPHTVGLRVLLDTLIGMNDAPPFLIPPTDQAPGQLVDTLATFDRGTMPAFLRALETDRLDDRTGTVAELNVKLHGCEPLDRLVLCHWPDNSEIRWEWKFWPMNEPPPDSCLVLYWAQQAMQPREERLLGFTYGLGQLYTEGQGGNQTASRRLLRLLIAGSGKVGGLLTATAYIRGDTLAGQKIALELPAALGFAAGQLAEQIVPRAGKQGYSQVSWRLRATQVGQHKVKVNLLGHSVEQEVQVQEKSLFD